METQARGLPIKGKEKCCNGRGTITSIASPTESLRTFLLL